MQSGEGKNHYNKLFPTATDGGTLVNAGGSPLFVYGEGPFRVGRFYMIANNAGKVSNLTVGPTQTIPSTLHERTGCPTFYRDSAAIRGYITDQVEKVKLSHSMISNVKNVIN